MDKDFVLSEYKKRLEEFKSKEELEKLRLEELKDLNKSIFSEYEGRKDALEELEGKFSDKEMEFIKLQNKELKKHNYIIEFDDGTYGTVSKDDIELVEKSRDSCLTLPINLIGNIKIIEKAEDDRIIAGYGNIAVVDSDNQLIPIEALKKGLETLMDDPAYANLMLVHKNIQIGKIIEKYGELETHVDDKGLFLVCQLRTDLKTADKIWEQILDGELNGFSIGCEIISEPQEKCDVNGENCIEVLNDINIFEVSICSTPINEMSGFVVVSKARYENGDFLNSDVCDECDKNMDTMVKKKVKSEAVKKEVKEETLEAPKAEDETKTEEEPTNESKEETTELSDEERIKNIERTIANIEAVLSKLNEEESKEEFDECKDDSSEEAKSEEKPTEEEKPSEVIKEETIVEPESEPKVETEPVEEKDTEVESEVESPDWKKSYDELKSVIDEFAENMSKSISGITDMIKEKEQKSDIDELEMAVKARDDKIEALEKKVNIYEKARDKENEEVIQKTVQDDTSTVKEEPIKDDEGLYVFERGTITKK